MTWEHIRNNEKNGLLRFYQSALSIHENGVRDLSGLQQNDIRVNCINRCANSFFHYALDQVTAIQFGEAYLSGDEGLCGEFLIPFERGLRSNCIGLVQDPGYWKEFKSRKRFNLTLEFHTAIEDISRYLQCLFTGTYDKFDVYDAFISRCNNLLSHFEAERIVTKAERKHLEAVLIFFNKLRNTQHNNAIHFDRYNKDYVYTFKDKKMRLMVGYRVEGCDDDILLALLTEVFDCFYKGVCWSAKTSPGLFEDLFYISQANS